MSTIRSHLTTASALVLALEALALCAGAAALCCRPARETSSSASQADCCGDATQGHVCPLKKTASPAGDAEQPAVWRAGCRAPDAAILSLLGLAGVLPAPPRADLTPTAERLDLPTLTAAEFVRLPASPPPRA